VLTIDFQHIDVTEGDCILDLGCGEGRHSIGAAYEHEGVNVVAIDLDLTDLSTGKKRHHEFDAQAAQRCLYTQADGAKLPLPNNCIDHVICSEVLEHIPDYKEILAEIDRVLKPGGTLNVSVPRYWPEKICWWLSTAYHNVKGGHIRIFRRSDLQSVIETLPYQYQKHHWAHALHVPYWWLRCAFWSQGETFIVTRIYHKLLVWDLLKRPKFTQILERLLNPIMGKSVVMYFVKAEQGHHE